MKRSNDPAPSISISVGRDNIGAIWVGDRNQVIINEKTGAKTEITAEEVRGLSKALSELRDRVASEAPPDQRDAALQKVDDLQDAILPKPETGKMQKVRDWFALHLPALLGGVTTVLVNPIVGKVVEAAGEMAAEAFRKRFAHA